MSATPAGPRAFQDLALSLAVSWGTLDVWQGRLVAAAAKAFAAYRWASRSPSSGSRAEAIAGSATSWGSPPFAEWANPDSDGRSRCPICHGDLQSQASTRVMLGMYYTLIGRSKKALPVLEEAQPIAKRLGAGLWKHRTRFQLGEALLSLAQFERATDVFQDAARLSRGAEPPIVGLANSFAGLAELRLGRVAPPSRWSTDRKVPGFVRTLICRCNGSSRWPSRRRPSSATVVSEEFPDRLSRGGNLAGEPRVRRLLRGDARSRRRRGRTPGPLAAVADRFEACRRRSRPARAATAGPPRLASGRRSRASIRRAPLRGLLRGGLSRAGSQPGAGRQGRGSLPQGGAADELAVRRVARAFVVGSGRSGD